MIKSLTEELCTYCGLCCDGTLLDDVELKDEKEAFGLELMGLNIDPDEPCAMLLPCSALKGTRCRFYEHRPGTCRRFECKLLHHAQCGEVAVEDAKVIISKTLKQAADVRRSCAEIEGREAQGSIRDMYQTVFEHYDPEKDPNGLLYPRLSQEMDILEELIHQHFLDQV